MLRNTEDYPDDMMYQELDMRRLDYGFNNANDDFWEQLENDSLMEIE